jgi:hypothetical protein
MHIPSEKTRNQKRRIGQYLSRWRIERWKDAAQRQSTFSRTVLPYAQHAIHKAAYGLIGERYFGLRPDSGFCVSDSHGTRHVLTLWYQILISHCNCWMSSPQHIDVDGL